MGLSCSKTAYPEEDDIAHHSGNHRLPSESNPRFRKRRGNGGLHHHHHHQYHNSGSSSITGSRAGIARSDPALFALQEQSIALYNNHHKTLDHHYVGQAHLLYKKQQQRQARQQSQQPQSTTSTTLQLQLQHRQDSAAFDDKQQHRSTMPYSSRLVVRRHALRPAEEGLSGTHIYAVRWPLQAPLLLGRPAAQEQSPYITTTTTHSNNHYSNTPFQPTPVPDPAAVDALFHPKTLAVTPQEEGMCCCCLC